MPEILLVKRRAGDAFGESYTFPGGVIDDNESNATRFGSGVTEDDANQFLGIDNGGLDFYSAGIRELFEETGIFLVRNNSGAWAACNSDIAVCRNEIDRGKRDWAAFLQQYRFNMAFDALHYFAHWITPLIRPKRWTTRFFLTEIPSGQTACHDGHETTDSPLDDGWGGATGRTIRQFAIALPDAKNPRKLAGDLRNIANSSLGTRTATGWRDCGAP